jgi:O-antigen/teichoic acid export membrane protein
MAESSEKHKGRSLLRAAFALAAGSGISAALSFLLTVLLARFLTSSDFTTYTLTLAWLFPAILIAEFGLSTLFLREVALYPALTRPLMRQLLPLRLALSSGVGLCFVVGLVAAGVGLPLSALLAASPLIVVLPLFNLLSAALRARSFMGWVAALNVGMIALQVGLLLLRPAWNTRDALLLNTFTSVLQLAAAAFIVWRVTAQDAAAAAGFCWRTWVLRCVPFAVASGLSAVQARLVLLLVDAQFTPLETAAYIVASRFSDAARLPLMAFFDALYPRLSAAPASVYLRRVLLRVTTSGASAAALALQAAPAVILWLFPAEYHAAAQLMPAVGILFLLASLRAAVNLYCYAAGHEHSANAVTLASMLTLTAAANCSMWLSIEHFLLAAAVVELAAACALFGLVAHASQRAATKSPYTPAE